MSFFDSWFDTEGGGSTDNTAPTIALVSPVTFSSDYSIARTTPVVIDVTDAGGISSVVIAVSGAGFTGTQLVFSTPSFTSLFSGSSYVGLPLGYRFNLVYDWQPGELDIFVLATDRSGNIATNTFSWVIAAAVTGTDLSGATEFRDSVWRWRRRLNRQKCSVISVAIDDNYTVGPGFVLTALSLEIARKPGLDPVPWRGGTHSNPSESGDNGDGT